MRDTKRVSIIIVLFTFIAVFSACSTDDTSGTANIDGDAVEQSEDIIEGSDSGCIVDTDCDEGYYCDNGRCREEDCNEELPCPTGYHCDNHICIKDDDPEDGDIDDDEEVETEMDNDPEIEPEIDQPPVICEAGEIMCQGNDLITCNEDGTQWSDPVPCPEGEVCIVDTCIPSTCDPDVWGECINEFMIYRCNSHGTGWEETPCPEHTYCEEGACIDIVCVPGEEIDCVDSSTVRKCTEEGNDWITEACEEGLTCIDGGCHEIICEAGEWLCEDEVLFYCNAFGTGWDEIMDCAESGSVCVEGTCLQQICEPGVTSCAEENSQTVKRCNDTGTAWEEIETCEGTDECRGGECMTLCEIAEFDRSYVGCNYWAVDLHNGSRDNGELALVVTNPQEFEISAHVADVNGVLQEKTIPAGGLVVFQLGSAHLLTGPQKSASAYKLQSTAPVTVTQMNPYGNVLIYSNDATLLLPEGALGKDYVGLAWQTHRIEICSCDFWFITCVGGYSCSGRDTSGFLTVVATQPGTTNVSIKYSAQTEGGGGISGESSGATRSYALSQFEVLNVESAGTDCPDVDDDRKIYCSGPDLTGSIISSDQKIAVFGGHECTFIPENMYACDHLEHQLFPVDTWGKNFVAVRTEPRGSETDYYRIVASEADTRVTLTPNPMGSGSVTLGEGQWTEFNTTQEFSIEATKPIMVGHYLAGQDATGYTLGASCSSDSDCPSGYICCYDCGNACSPEAGDPAMMLLAPTEQFRKHYIFLVPPNYKYDHITLIAPPDTEISIDGSTQLDSNNFPAVSGEFRRTRVALADGPHTIVATEPVGLYVYGYSAFVSYAYTAGLDLKEINPKP